ncbi:hypothetical protein Pcinc_031596 [Petrolisthes cinctipes]|uniref:Uncharacterized protein n=1 Tax=Petrolisthes cinctipes TaxID=88211 RepID=A0AAE1K4B4_PETCI|nr:hypothetical protein Pcinc_031596 [Petrolisthes cinctipes]
MSHILVLLILVLIIFSSYIFHLLFLRHHPHNFLLITFSPQFPSHNLVTIIFLVQFHSPTVISRLPPAARHLQKPSPPLRPNTRTELQLPASKNRPRLPCTGEIRLEFYSPKLRIESQEAGRSEKQEERKRECRTHFEEAVVGILTGLHGARSERNGY